MSDRHSGSTTNHLQQLPGLATASYRLCRVAFHIAYGMLLAAIYPLLGKPIQQRILKHWSRKLLDVLHVGLETSCFTNMAAERGRLFVANHISWLDAIALTAVVTPHFIAKSEVRDWPLLGWMCRRSNVLFIKRDARQDIAQVNRQLVEMLKRGEYIALFPEGTTTADTYPGHFHSSLFQVPIDAGAALHPVAIRYHNGSGQPCEDAAFVGDMTFVSSLWKILRSPSLHVTLVYLPVIACAGKNRRMLATEAQGAIHMGLSALSGCESVHTPDGAMASNWRSAAAVVYLPKMDRYQSVPRLHRG